MRSGVPGRFYKLYENIIPIPYNTYSAQWCALVTSDSTTSYLEISSSIRKHLLIIKLLRIKITIIEINFDMKREQ